MMPDAPDLAGSLSAPGDAAVSPNPPGRPRFSSHEVFLGRDGLRAGWSLLVYFSLLITLLFASGMLIRRFEPQPGAPSPGAVSHLELIPPKLMLLSEGLELLAVAVATWIMARIEQRAVAAFGLARERWLGNFFAGLAWGVAFLSLLVFLLRESGLLVFDARLLFGRSALRYGAVWFVGFLLVGLFEEYVTRGYLQFTLTRGLGGIYGWFFGTQHANALGFWTAALLLSVFFGLGHSSNQGESPIGLVSAGLIGLVLCLSLWRTGSLWWAVGFHAAWDWAQSFLYGVADSGNMVQGHLFATHPMGRPILSGGLTGPEGSLFILPIVALVSAVIVLTLRNTRSSSSSDTL
jgi:uncharacterized protein